MHSSRMRADRSLTVPWRIQEEEGRWCVWSGGCLTIQVPSDQAPTPLPSEDRITDACKNITPPPLLCVKKCPSISTGSKGELFTYTCTFVLCECEINNSLHSVFRTQSYQEKVGAKNSIFEEDAGQ